MEQDSGMHLSLLKVDGGASKNDFLMQFQADLLRVKVERPEVVETTALGAAYLAGLAVGYWKDKEEIAHNWCLDKTFQADLEIEKKEKLLKGWAKAIGCSSHWIEA